MTSEARVWCCCFVGVSHRQAIHMSSKMRIMAGDGLQCTLYFLIIRLENNGNDDWLVRENSDLLLLFYFEPVCPGRRNTGPPRSLNLIF